jgi:hypothetical protein
MSHPVQQVFPALAYIASLLVAKKSLITSSTGRQPQLQRRHQEAEGHRGQRQVDADA